MCFALGSLNFRVWRALHYSVNFPTSCPRRFILFLWRNSPSFVVWGGGGCGGVNALAARLSLHGSEVGFDFFI